MKLTIERAALLKALGHVQSVVERRNTIPILSNVLLRGADGKLALSATDMDLEMVSSVPAQGVKAGGTTVPAHTLYDITRKLPDGAQVSLEIGADKAQMTLTSEPFDLHPRLPAARGLSGITGGELGLPFTVPRPPDPHALSTATRVSDLDRGDALLPQRHVSPRRQERRRCNMLRAVATDGHRLARMELPLPLDGASGMPGVIVPRKTVRRIEKAPG